MNLKYFGIDDASIDERFKDSSYIPELIIKNKESILDNYLNPSLTYDENGEEVFYPKVMKIDDNLYLKSMDFYEYGIVYSVFSTNSNNNENDINASAKLIVASNNASFFIDGISNNSDKTVNAKLDLIMNLKQEKIFIEALGSKVEFEKMYGSRNNNTILKFIDNSARKKEEQVIKYAVNNSMRVISESLEDNKKVLTKTRF